MGSGMDSHDRPQRVSLRLRDYDYTAAGLRRLFAEAGFDRVDLHPQLNDADYELNRKPLGAAQRRPSAPQGFAGTVAR